MSSSTVGSPLPFDPLDLIYRLRRKGYSLSRVARELDLARSTVYQAIFTGSSERVRGYVSEVLKTPEETLWPFRFPN